MSEIELLLIAKAPVAGRSKTRLCPPCTPEQAAQLAEAALRDTLAVLAATPAKRRTVVLEGEPGAWLPEQGFEVVPQRAGGLDERLAGAFEATDGPALLVGMDTPQLTGALLAEGLDALAAPGVDAVLGPAPDGGYWAVGLREPRPEVFRGVPMSEETTLAAQRERLRELGMRWEEISPLRDVDTIDDARAVASECAGTHFATLMESIDGQRDRAA